MSIVKLKVLKPQTLKQKEMRLELLNGLRKVARAVKKDYEATTATWTKPIEFEMIIALGKTKAEFLVGTDNEIYGYIDEGTKPHIIRPKKAKMLRFMAGSQPKTTPGILKSGSGAAGSTEVFSRGVMHPGTNARRFSEVINKKHKKAFKDEMHKSMARAREKSGHKI